MQKTNQRIGFIGLGVMGQSMVRNLLKAGFPTTIYNRTRSKAEALEKSGARWADNPAKVAEESDVIITIVGYPKDVEEVYLGENGVLSGVRAGSIVIDMTTSSPELAKTISQAAADKDVQALDAPVSGGDKGAKEAKLSIMVGGEEAAFHQVSGVFKAMGANIVYQGPAGSGQYTKMCNQIAIAAGMISICESMHYAKASGLDPFTVLKSIESGAAGSWSLSNLAPRILKGDFEPGFYVKHFIKDMTIAIESAEKMNLVLPGLRLAKQLYDQLAATGGENLGTQGLYKLYEESLFDGK